MDFLSNSKKFKSEKKTIAWLIGKVKYEEYPDFFRTKTKDLDFYKNYTITHCTKLGNTRAYVVTNKTDTYIAFKYIVPFLWIPIKTENDYNNLSSTYNTNYGLQLKKFKGYIGNCGMLGFDFNGCVRYILESEFTDKYIWNKSHDFKFEKEVKQLNKFEYLELNHTAFDSNKNNIVFRTKLSKSQITIENYNEHYLIEIAYNPHTHTNITEINNEYSRNYNTDLPIDVISFIVHFPFLTCDDIIKFDHLECEYIDICMHICNDNVEFIDKLKSIKNTCSGEVLEMIDNIIKQYDDTQYVTSLSEKLIMSEIMENIMKEIDEIRTQYAENDNTMLTNFAILRTIKSIIFQDQ
jgi:hypothetical protein